ncbi:hypothetical protein PENTCL1PPCAC_16902, partial [Pristionchus entomophagus]
SVQYVPAASSHTWFVQCGMVIPITRLVVNGRSIGPPPFLCIRIAHQPYQQPSTLSPVRLLFVIVNDHCTGTHLVTCSSC